MECSRFNERLYLKNSKLAGIEKDTNTDLWISHMCKHTCTPLTHTHMYVHTHTDDQESTIQFNHTVLEDGRSGSSAIGSCFGKRGSCLPIPLLAIARYTVVFMCSQSW